MKCYEYNLINTSTTKDSITKLRMETSYFYIPDRDLPHFSGRLVANKK